MPTVQVRPEFSYVLLTDGFTYTAGERATLSDGQFQELNPATLRALFVLDATEAEPEQPVPTLEQPPIMQAPAQQVVPEVFIQDHPVTTWIFEHHMGRLPAVQVSLPNGRVVMPDITIDSQTVIITWNEPTSGSVIIT